MRLAPWLPFLADMGALPQCARGDYSHCSHDPARCASHRRKANGVEWATCPVREVSSSAELRYLLALERDMQVSPVTGWTSSFAAWVPAFLRAYRAERDKAAAKTRRVEEL